MKTMFRVLINPLNLPVIKNEPKPPKQQAVSLKLYKQGFIAFTRNEMIVSILFRLYRCLI